MYKIKFKDEMFYLIINKNKKEIISNQVGMEVLYQILSGDTLGIKKLVISSVEKEPLIDTFREELLIYKTQNIQINLRNRKYIKLKDLTISDILISSLSCFYMCFLKLIDDWEKFKNDDWKQFVILFNGETFTLIPIYANDSLYVENLIKENKNKSYLISLYDVIGNTTFEHVTMNDSGMYLICYLFGEPVILMYYLNETQEFLKPFTNYGMCYEDICINCLNDNSIEIDGRDEKINRKIKLTKDSFANVTKQWYDLQNEFELYGVSDLKKLKMTYFNNEISFECELNPELISEVVKKNAKRNENSL